MTPSKRIESIRREFIVNDSALKAARMISGAAKRSSRYRRSRRSADDQLAFHALFAVILDGAEYRVLAAFYRHEIEVELAADH